MNQIIFKVSKQQFKGRLQNRIHPLRGLLIRTYPKNICAKNTSRKDDTRKDTNSAMKSEKSVEKDDIKKTENTIDEKKSVGEEVCQINKEEIVFR